MRLNRTSASLHRLQMHKSHTMIRFVLCRRCDRCAPLQNWLQAWSHMCVLCQRTNCLSINLCNFYSPNLVRCAAATADIENECAGISTSVFMTTQTNVQEKYNSNRQQQQQTTVDEEHSFSIWLSNAALKWNDEWHEWNGHRMAKWTHLARGMNDKYFSHTISHRS